MSVALQKNTKFSLAPRKERGAVLLTTLLVMAIMAALAVAILDDLRFAVKRAVNLENHAQAEWYVQGAEAFAELLIDESLSAIAPENRPSYLRSIADNPFVFPLDGVFTTSGDDTISGGTLVLSIRDAGDCVALAKLGEAAVQRQFQTLLMSLGWQEFEAEALLAKVIDWQDADTDTGQNGAEDFTYLGQKPAYRTSNVPFASVSELRLVEGIEPSDIQALRPFLCTRAGGGSSKLSVNSLTAQHVPVLAALISDDRRLELAKQLIEARPVNGYTDIEAIKSLSVLDGIDTKNIAFDMMSFETENIWVEVEIRLGTSVRYLALEFAFGGEGEAAGFKTTFRRRSFEAFRPRPTDLEASAL